MRIYSLEITNNPILGNIFLDFTDLHGNISDTIIFAGENGCGKTTLLECLSLHNNNFADNEIRKYVLEIDEHISEMVNNTAKRFTPSHVSKRIAKAEYTLHKIGNNIKTFANYYDNDGNTFLKDYSFDSPCVYLTPEINFFPDTISSVTSKSTDSYSGGFQKSTKNIATEITQLIIDIATQDKFDFSELYENDPRSDYNIVQRSPRISRFNIAFSKIIPDFKIKKVENQNGSKVVTFSNKGKIVPIAKLSSGEKQIVFRGGYLLKDMNTSKGATILIDEPELSLHPDWQKKILDYYKAIFTDENDKQTSQIFIATHSPYIIHNKNRKNDKVIVLKKDDKANVRIMDKPEYYSCGDVMAVEDAFNDKLFTIETSSTIYLEGRTDEKYFNRALEVFGITPSWKFKWIGYLDSNGQEKNAGKDNLNKVKDFLISQNLPIKNICLFDNDTNKNHEEYSNIISYAIPQYKSSKNIKRGIENTLILNDINLEDYYNKKESVNDYGEIKMISTLEKMRLCNDICSKPDNELKSIFANLKLEIEKIDKLIKGES